MDALSIQVVVLTMLGICTPVGIGVAIHEARVKSKKKRNAIPEAQEIAATFHAMLVCAAERDVSQEFSKSGIPIIVEFSRNNPDFCNAVQKRMNTYYSLGITETAAIQYIQTNYPQLKRMNLGLAVQEYLNFALQNGRQVLERKRIEVEKQYGMTPQAFFQSARSVTGDLVGVYIIYNQTKDMYYVGQAKRLYFRVKQHFTGHGNGDVYADYKYGDAFLIRLITLRESGYDDLDRLERDMIAKYHAYESGYNKNAGNRS